jgi:seryl-tRNA synthetase
MLNIQFIRDNVDLVTEKSKQKGYDVNIKRLIELDTKRRELITKVDEIRQKRHETSAHANAKKPSQQQIATGKELKEQLAASEAILQKIDQEYSNLLKQVPNMPMDDVPVGTSEEDNQVAKTVGEPTKFDFEPKNHVDLAIDHDWLDKERAAKVAGSRFAYIKGDLVRMQFALIQFALDSLTDESVLTHIIQTNNLKVSSKPFTPILPPAMARTEVYEATARLNKEEQTYKLADDDLWLNASAEHTLAPMYIDEIIGESELPIRYIGYTTAFRREAGTYGKDMEGIFRLHQFDKLEMESFSLPADSLQEHLFMIAIQEYFMQQLNLPYQVILKCTADIGGPNARGVDINTWLPGQNQYRETHTADYMTDFQARRMRTRVKYQDQHIEFVHTNDATAFAMGRTLIAIIENYQDQSGNIRIPEILKPYMKV